MENLLSSALSHATLPGSFIFPPDQRSPASFRVVSLTQSHATHAMEMETSTAAAGSTRRLLRLAAFLFLCSITPVRATKKQSSYIVYLGGGGVSMEEASMVATKSHYDLLGSVLGDREKARDAIFYFYTKNINGFAAVLDPDVAAEIAGHPGVVSVFPNSSRKMHTTRSWEFLGLERGGEISR